MGNIAFSRVGNCKWSKMNVDDIVLGYEEGKKLSGGHLSNGTFDLWTYEPLVFRETDI